MINEELLNKILDEIFQLNIPAIDNSRRTQIGEFIKSTINGDTPQNYLVISAVLGKNKNGALVYILTNARLIKVDIDDKNNISSTSPSLSTIINIEKKLEDNNRAKVALYFQNDYISLTYTANNQKINDFFQKVDLARVQGKL